MAEVELWLSDVATNGKVRAKTVEQPFGGNDPQWDIPALDPASRNQTIVKPTLDG